MCFNKLFFSVRFCSPPLIRTTSTSVNLCRSNSPIFSFEFFNSSNQVSFYFKLCLHLVHTYREGSKAKNTWRLYSEEVRTVKYQNQQFRPKFRGKCSFFIVFYSFPRFSGSQIVKTTNDKITFITVTMMLVVTFA